LLEQAEADKGYADKVYIGKCQAPTLRTTTTSSKEQRTTWRASNPQTGS